MIRNKGKILDSTMNKTPTKYMEFINKTKEPIKIKRLKSAYDDKKDNINDNNSHFEIISTYNYILYKLESLLNSLNDYNYNYVYSQLINIKKAINEITSNKKILKTFINKKTEEDDKYNNFGKISFDKELNRHNKSCTELDVNALKYNSIKKKRKINMLKQKNSDLEDKLKTENLKYLFCIGEQNMEIQKLEKELNKRSFGNMTQKDFRCFPNYRKFEKSDSSSNITKHQNLKVNTRPTSYNKKNLKKFYHEEYLDHSENKHETALNNNGEDLTEKEKNLIIEYGEKVVNQKKFKRNKLMDKKRKYYISHPKLKYIKNDLNMKSWKTNEILDSFPKSLLRHKFISKSQRNNLVIFPSSINQIITNLEKLRIHNNFKRIENDFKENNKYKKKSIKY